MPLYGMIQLPQNVEVVMEAEQILYQRQLLKGEAIQQKQTAQAAMEVY